MQIDGWKYYNHAVVPTTAPHEEPNMLPIKNGNIWKLGGGSIIGKVDHRIRLWLRNKLVVRY